MTTRSSRTSRPHRPPPSSLGEERIPESYIVILQPTVTPYDMLSSVLKGYKPTFTYGSIFTGFAVDRVPLQKADEIRLDSRVLKVVENRVVSALSRELLIETLQTKYTVVNRDTGELYDVREVDNSMPYRYSVLPHNMRVPQKARQVLGINEQPTHVPPKAAKVFGHNPYRQHLTKRDVPMTDKAAQLLGVIPPSSGGDWVGDGGFRRPSVGRGPRGMVEEEDAEDWGRPRNVVEDDDDGMGMLHSHGGGLYMEKSERHAEMAPSGAYMNDDEEGQDLPVALWKQRRARVTLNQ